MTSETNEQFVDRISRAIYDSNSIHKDADLIRLFVLTRRGAEAADRIEQLEAALAMFACDCTVSERCAVPDNCCNFQARRTLEERT